MDSWYAVASPPRNWKKTLKRYAAALLAVAIMSALRWLFGPWLGGRAPFSTYTIAVAFCAWYGGFGPALLALGLGTTLAIWLFADPTMFSDPQRVMALILAIVSGLFVAFLGAARRRAELRADTRQNILDQVFSQMTDGFMVINPKGRPLYVNEPMASLLARTRDEAFATLIYEVPPERIPKQLNELIKSVLEKRVPGTVELQFGPNKSWHEIHVSPSPQGITLTASNIEPRKIAEQKIENSLRSEQEARNEAERANRMKDEFLATLSHELRTPLNSIMGWSQLLNGPVVNEGDLKQGMAAIERNAKAQAQLIEDLLDMSRITSGRLKLDVRPVSLATCIEAAIESVAPAANAKQIAIIRDFAQDVSPIEGDAVRLQQVIWNLLSNAIKFTPAGGSVTTSLANVDGAVQLRVTDTGEGIDEAFIPQMFGRFMQADGSSTRRHGGLGLGLAIVRQLVEQHGGTIGAASSGRGKGSVFTLRLPLPRHPPLISEASDSSPHPVIADLRNLNVLVVDDEPETREIIQRILQGCGASVRAMQDAHSAYAQFAIKPPDVLVSDIAMPGEDGYSLIRRVRALPVESGGTVPALALTAFARTEDLNRSLKSGYQAHLAKPFEASNLVKKIAELTHR